MKIKRREGFIVHPFETGNGQYHASYGNHNKTVRSFSTLRQAKNHLRRQGIEHATYDSPSGVKLVATKNVRRRIPARRSIFHMQMPHMPRL